MTILIEGPDGVQVEFPDDTPPTVMRDAMRKKFGWQPPAATQPAGFDKPMVPFYVDDGKGGQINVNANNLSESEFEVTLSVEGKAENAGKVMFSFELAYAGVFRITNVPKENLHPLVMIECPRLLFPFAREIIATAVLDGGFPPLMLDPVDFVGLYRQNMELQMAAQPTSGQA